MLVSCKILRIKKAVIPKPNKIPRLVLLIKRIKKEQLAKKTSGKNKYKELRVKGKGFMLREKFGGNFAVSQTIRPQSNIVNIKSGRRFLRRLINK